MPIHVQVGLCAKQEEDGECLGVLSSVHTWMQVGISTFAILSTMASSSLLSGIICTSYFPLTYRQQPKLVSPTQAEEKKRMVLLFESICMDFQAQTGNTSLRSESEIHIYQQIFIEKTTKPQTWAIDSECCFELFALIFCSFAGHPINFV